MFNLVLSSVGELWKTFIEWCNGNGIDIIASLGTIGGVILSSGVVTKVVNKAKAKEILAVAETNAKSKEFKETSEKIGEIENNQLSLEETMNKIIGLLMIVINNSKIDPKAKTQALELFTAGSKTVKEVTKTVEEVVEKITKYAEEQVKEEETEHKEVNPYIENIEGLVNEANETKDKI